MSNTHHTITHIITNLKTLPFSQLCTYTEDFRHILLTLLEDSESTGHGDLESPKAQIALLEKYLLPHEVARVLLTQDPNHTHYKYFKKIFSEATNTNAHYIPELYAVLLRHIQKKKKYKIWKRYEDLSLVISFLKYKEQQAPQIDLYLGELFEIYNNYIQKSKNERKHRIAYTTSYHACNHYLAVPTISRDFLFQVYQNHLDTYLKDWLFEEAVKNYGAYESLYNKIINRENSTPSKEMPLFKDLFIDTYLHYVQIQLNLFLKSSSEDFILEKVPVFHKRLNAIENILKKKNLPLTEKQQHTLNLIRAILIALLCNSIKAWEVYDTIPTSFFSSSQDTVLLSLNSFFHEIIEENGLSVQINKMDIELPSDFENLSHEDQIALLMMLTTWHHTSATLEELNSLIAKQSYNLTATDPENN